MKTLEQLIQYDYSLKKDIFNHNFLPPNTIQIPIVNPEQFIGVEVEVENVGKKNNVNSFLPENWYQIEQDGSLRNNGLEFITRPHPAEYTQDILTGIMNGVRA